MPSIQAIVLSLLFAQLPAHIFSDSFETGTTAAWSQSPSPPIPSGTGYQPRPCGFDLNDNGLLGEPADCHICDGSTLDPDGDGVNEDLIYVDCANGADNQECGSPGQPCRTIQFAANQRTDGPGDGAEDIVCFTGECSVSMFEPQMSGVSDEYVRPRTGSQATDFEYPKNPAMIVGWDRNGNGIYPPQDDHSVLRGGTRAFNMNASQEQHHIELAHFVAMDYNAPQGQQAGFMKPANGRGGHHIYVHDLKLERINNCVQYDHKLLVDLFHSHLLNWFAFENIDGYDLGAWWLRGTAGDGPTEATHWRFANLSLRNNSCGNHHSGLKIWGWVTGVELLDSYFEGNPEPTGQVSAVGFAQCARGLTMRGNFFRDYQNLFVAQGSATGFCEGSRARTVSDVWVEANTLWNTYGDLQVWRFAPVAVRISADSSDSPAESVEDVTIVNNFIGSVGPGYESCFLYTGGNRGGPQPGTVVFSQNTCAGHLKRDGFAAIQIEENGLNVHQNMEITNNLVVGLDVNRNDGTSNPDEAITFRYQPSNLMMAGNLVTPGSTLRNVQGGVGFCENPLINAPQGDLHLAPGCAVDAGVMTAYTRDWDREARPAGGAFDVGADEFNGTAPLPPPDDPPPPDPEPDPEPQPPDPEPEPDPGVITDLIQRISTLEAQVSELVASGEAAQGDVDELQSIVTELEARVSAIEDDTTAAELRAVLDAIAAAIEENR